MFPFSVFVIFLLSGSLFQLFHEHFNLYVETVSGHRLTLPSSWFATILVNGPASKNTPFLVSKPNKTNVLIVLLLLLSGDVELNPGPVNFGFTNCRSLRNKGPLMTNLLNSGAYDLFGLTETHIKPSDTAGHLSSLHPDHYKLIHTPRQGKGGGGVGFLVRKEFECEKLSTPLFSSFEHIAICVKSSTLSGVFCLHL